MSELTTFCVAFSDIRHMRIRLKAHSAADAIKKAERIYIDTPEDDSVTMWIHDPICTAKAKGVVTFADIARRHGAGGGP